MKRIVAVLLALCVTAGAAAAVPAVRDEAQWRWAAHHDEASDYRAYLDDWPDGAACRPGATPVRSEGLADYARRRHRPCLRVVPRRPSPGAHVEDAARRLEGLRWEAARAAGTVRAFEQFLSVHSAGRRADEARAELESLHWRDAEEVGTEAALERYLGLYPQGHHAAAARAGIERLVFERGRAENTTGALQAYLETYPEGAFAREASRLIEEIRWDAARAAGTVVALHRYLRSEPASEFARRARARIAALRNDDAPFRVAARSGTQAAFRRFLREFPGHRRESDARERIQELAGVDIATLVAQGKVEIQVIGDDITGVTVKLRRRVDRTLTAVIPAGTFFAARSSWIQNMVATDPASVRLGGNGWASVWVETACANRTRSIPGPGDRFDIGASPHGGVLTRLTRQMARADVVFEVEQAAIWIVTDNAGYDDLGILVYQFGGRVIDAGHAARAMRLVDAAGLPITSRAIWYDREQIASALGSQSFRRWVDARA